MLGDFQHQGLALIFRRDSVHNRRQFAVKLNVNDRAGDLRHSADDVLSHGVAPDSNYSKFKALRRRI
jgi:hypothetical protein